jgi:hypothetical protein
MTLPSSSSSTTAISSCPLVDREEASGVIH